MTRQYKVQTSAMAEKGGKKDPSKRVNAFRGAKPYYGSSMLGFREKVPPLFLQTIECILKNELTVDPLPPVLKNKVDYYKKYETLPGPIVLKCSVCGKFYTSSEKFDVHECTQS